MPTWRIWLRHWARRAVSRAAPMPGKISAANTAMIEITTKSSISVNPQRCGFRRPRRVTCIVPAPAEKSLERQNARKRQAQSRLQSAVQDTKLNVMRQILCAAAAEDGTNFCDLRYRLYDLAAAPPR